MWMDDWQVWVFFLLGAALPWGLRYAWNRYRERNRRGIRFPNRR